MLFMPETFTYVEFSEEDNGNIKSSDILMTIA